MFDFHYDLLTKLYISYLNDDFGEIEEICKAFRLDNVSMLIANLSFETEQEMKKEYHQGYWNSEVGMKEIFYIATSLVSQFVAPEIEVIYSIEGCDYVELDDLPILYEMGLRSIIPVWNHQNQYGSGNRTEAGLTQKGIQLIEKAVDLGIAIDLSHANPETFYDMIDVIKRLQDNHKKVVFFASHSNARTLCDRARNLTDEQLLCIHKLGGKVGVFSNRNFVVQHDLQKKVSLDQLKQAYLKHIRYLESLFGGIDSIVLSTDDMGWLATPAGDLEYAQLAIYPYSNIAELLSNTLSTVYGPEDVEKLLYKNGRQLFLEKEIKRK